MLTVAAAACKQTKFVPKDKYLLKKNVIVQTGKEFDKDDLAEIVRQQPNYKRFGVKWKLMAFNSVDSTKVANKRKRKNAELREKNKKRIAKQNRINQERIEKARRKGKTLYTKKIIPLKDTVNPRLFLREWYKYRIGRPPVIFDSTLYEKSLEQLQAYMKSKGYYYGTVTGMVRYKPNQKAVVTYSVDPGKQYIIDSVYVKSSNPSVISNYQKFVRKKGDKLTGQPFDTDELDDFRTEVSKFMRNDAMFGFSASHVLFEADTNRTDMTVDLGVLFQDRLVRPSDNPDTLIKVPHRTTLVRDVYFHIADTTLYKGSFKGKMDELGLSLYDGQFIRTVDTLDFGLNDDKKRRATFTYNGKMFLRPGLIEHQNYLESTNYYKEYYLERSYNRLLQLGLFQAIKTELNEVEGTNLVDVHYYLVPNKRQSFGIEPKATNSNGFLGVAASLNYTNRNLFRGGEKLTLSFSGGFESQPPVFDQTVDGQVIQTAARSFNTFEIGPSAKLEIPGLFPMKLGRISKRHRPKTAISFAYNFQSRDAFKRGTFQLNYLWQFNVLKTQSFQAGLPGASVIKFVNISNTPEFEQTLANLNDLFLLNAYSDQFIWQDWKFIFEYTNKNSEQRSRTQLYFKSSFDPAGNLLSLFKRYQDTTENGEYKIFGVKYAQFVRLDNEFIISQPLGSDHSLHFRVNAGGGLPYGNSVSLPYDYSFFAGGANDNRGWRARALGPGTYKYYLDQNRTATQIGDLRIGGSMEYRFAFNSFFKGAVFLDAGNIWTVENDTNRVGGQFTRSWINQLGIASGVGLRLDFDFFVLRIDLGFPIRNPALPSGARWIFQSRQPYYDEGEAELGANYMELLPAPFSPQLHFGIGYPF